MCLCVKSLLDTLKLACRSLLTSAFSFLRCTSELYPFVFFSLRGHSKECVRLLNTSTKYGIDKIYNSRYHGS